MITSLFSLVTAPKTRGHTYAGSGSSAAGGFVRDQRAGDGEAQGLRCGVQGVRVHEKDIGR